MDRTDMQVHIRTLPPLVQKMDFQPSLFWNLSKRNRFALKYVFTLDDVEFRVACFILLLRRRAVPVKNLLAGGVAPLLCWPRRPRSSYCLPDCFSGLQIRGGREKRLKKISNSLLVLQYPIFFFVRNHWGVTMGKQRKIQNHLGHNGGIFLWLI